MHTNAIKGREREREKYFALPFCLEILCALSEHAFPIRVGEVGEGAVWHGAAGGLVLREDPRAAHLPRHAYRTATRRELVLFCFTRQAGRQAGRQTGKWASKPLLPLQAV